MPASSPRFTTATAAASAGSSKWRCRKLEPGPSPTIGQHNAEIYGGGLGLSIAEIAELKETGVI